MSKIDDGGPAFPTQERKTEQWMDECGRSRITKVHVPVPGMSLRDYFAAAALQGIIAGKVPLGELNDGIRNVVESQATCAYMVADAMLQQRKEQP